MYNYIAGIPVQLKPCRFIPEMFLCGDNDPDWVYILWGVVFGINTDCKVNYKAKHRNVRDKNLRNIITSKFLTELDQGIISISPSPPTCIHNMFCIPKESGGRGIVDCSRPKGTSVNNYTDQVANTFHYNSVDNV